MHALVSRFSESFGNFHMKVAIAKPPQEKSIGEACLVSITSSTKTQPNGRISWPTFLKEASSILGGPNFQSS